MPSEHYFNKIKDTIRAYGARNNYALTDTDVLDAVKSAVEDIYDAVGHKATLVSDGSGTRIVTGSKQEVPFKSVFSITKPAYLLERAKFHIEKKITAQSGTQDGSTAAVCKPIKVNPHYDPQEYLKTVKSAVNNYLRENNYHLEESEVYEAIKCAVEDTCLTIGKKVILDISGMPPRLLDITNMDEIYEIPLTGIFAFIKPQYFLERIRFFIDRFERGKIYSTYTASRGQIIRAEVMGETFFLGSRSFELLQVKKRFEGMLFEFGKKYDMYVESGKEKIVVYPGDYRMWDLAAYIYGETGYAMSINPCRKILRLKQQSKAVVFNIFGAIGIMPADERIPGEEYKPGTEWDIILYDVNQAAREGYQLYVSRRQVDFIKNYIASFIPEFRNLKIRGVAREPGVCSKILVEYNGSGPVKWGKYRESLREIQDGLSGERIEIIEYDPDDIEKTIQSALNYDGHIKINSVEKIATVITTNKGAVIGKKGYNVRLAGMLTGFKFTVMTPDEYLVAL